MHEIVLRDLGHGAYKPVWDFQEKLLQQKIEAKKSGTFQPDYLLFVEHNPVYTLGKNGKEKNLLISEQLLKQKGIEFFHINRGGDITFHGPEQLVGYPILDLDNYKTDLGWYLRSLVDNVLLGSKAQQWRALSEIEVGSCDGMTTAEFKRLMPEEFQARKQDKLRYRYPR